MAPRPKTVAEMARMGGVARAKAHSKAELRAWGKRGGRPPRLGRKGLSHLKRLLAAGRSQAERGCPRGVRSHCGSGGSSNEERQERTVVEHAVTTRREQGLHRDALGLFALLYAPA